MLNYLLELSQLCSGVIFQHLKSMILMVLEASCAEGDTMIQTKIDVLLFMLVAKVSVPVNEGHARDAGLRG